MIGLLEGIDPKLLEEVTKLFRKAEQTMKNMGRELGEAIVPSINQLRYAGSHILNVCNSSSVEAANTELEKAKRHCQRAFYDAVEAGVMDKLAAIRKFKIEFGPLLHHDPSIDYSDLFKKARDANDEIQRIDVVNTKDKESSFLSIEGFWHSLNEVQKILDERLFYLEKIRSKMERERYDASVAARDKVEKSNRRLAWATLVAAIAALVLTVPGSILDIRDLVNRPSCTNGEARACFCGDVKTGTSVCGDNGDWSACSCGK